MCVMWICAYVNKHMLIYVGMVLMCTGAFALEYTPLFRAVPDDGCFPHSVSILFMKTESLVELRA